MNFRSIIVAAPVALLAGCTSVDIRPLESTERITKVVIRKNPTVMVADFIDVLVAGFERHGIATKLASNDAEYEDTYVVNYVAYRSWDVVPYLTDATITIDRNGTRIAEARYHLWGNGGFSLMKWRSTRAKIDPVLDQLLGGIAPKTPRKKETG